MNFRMVSMCRPFLMKIHGNSSESIDFLIKRILPQLTRRLLPKQDPKYLDIQYFAAFAAIASCLEENQISNSKKVLKLTDRFHALILSGKHKLNAQILFRGWRLDANFRKASRPTMFYRNATGVMVDQEFYTEFLAGWKLLSLKLHWARMNRAVAIRWHYRLIGHGVGGVFAIFTALGILYNGKLPPGHIPDIKIFTYGLPRIGNQQFSNHINTLLKDSVFRVTNYDDLIPRLPQPTRQIKWTHHAREYWIAKVDCDCQGLSTDNEPKLYECYELKGPREDLYESKRSKSVDHRDGVENQRHSGSLYDKIRLSKTDPRNTKFELYAYVSQRASCLEENYKLTPNIYVKIEKVRLDKEFQVSFKGRFLTIEFAQNERSQIPYDEKIKGSMVDEEFYREFSAGRSVLEKRVDEVLKHSKYKRLVFTGHGVGGGNGIDINILHDERLSFLKKLIRIFYKVYAVFAGLYFQSRFRWVKQWGLDIEVYTYGQPRIGNLMFSHYVNTKLPGKIFRMTNYNDFVPKYPKLHFGNEFLHYAREFWSDRAPCDCPGRRSEPRPNVYECPEPLTTEGYRLESSSCNADAHGDMDTAMMFHLGPYFGHFMTLFDDRLFMISYSVFIGYSNVELRITGERWLYLNVEFELLVGGGYMLSCKLLVKFMYYWWVMVIRMLNSRITGGRGYSDVESRIIGGWWLYSKVELRIISEWWLYSNVESRIIGG
ncbi:hypothetical protein G9A89_005387 [Geosiphon pyriformis]|nr:hypothetical protein G9A89_005387 [Geosiphon pyriformis]